MCLTLHAVRNLVPAKIQAQFTQVDIEDVR